MLPNIGWGELLIIFIIVLLLFGAKRLPEIGRGLGQAIKSFKDGFKNEDKEEKELPDKTDKQENEPRPG